MGIINKIKEVFSKLISPKDIEDALKITPIISSTMQQNIELWESMYKDESPWLNENVHSLGLASMIASEKARMATLEMQVKVTGDSEKAKFYDEVFHKITRSIRKELEYGIALGGIVIKPYVVKGVDGKLNFEFNYTKATNFYPLAFSSEGEVTEAAFLDRIITKDDVFTKLEYHKLDGSTLIIANLAYKAHNGNMVISGYNSYLGTPIPLTDVPAWELIEPQVIIENAGTMLFTYFKMPEANTVDIHSPLGASGFSRAVDLIKQADLQYSNLLWEFEGGQLAVDVDRTALNPLKTTDGKEFEVLPKLQDRLFRRSLDLGEDNMYNVFSPELRDKSIINGLNTILMHLEDVCAISRGTLSEVTISEARTATELKILKQRSYAANSDIQKHLQKSFEDIFKILDVYCNLYDIVGDGEYEVAYRWDDSIIVDKDAEKQLDLIEVDKGLMSKVEYRMKWFGETQKQAEEAMEQIEKEQQAKITMQQQIFSNTPNNNAKDNTQQSNTQDKLQNANKSTETTTIN